MEESSSSAVWDGRITGIRFGLATNLEICTSSVSDFPISHASQLANPFLGLPLESGKCESCGAAEPGSCEGHFGYIELPIPIYHPSHVSELKRLLSLLCLKCLKMKNVKLQIKNVGILEKTLSSCCEETSQVSVNEVKTADGSCFLELKLPSRSRLKDGFWNFLEKYGYRYGDNFCRPLLPSEVMAILKKLPESTKKKLALKGYFPQEGYILQCIPVPPNCLSVPDVSDGITVMSSDISSTMLKKVLKQIETIKSSRSGTPNFESHEVEANDLQSIVAQYLQIRGTSKASRDIDSRLGVKELNDSSTKAWLEKMKTLFIRKGSGFSSRSVITGDAYKGVNEIGLPSEIAQRITFEERVTEHNMQYLQKLVDEKLCLTYRDGSSTYSLREGSKGHTLLRIGQVVHRRIMDGDIVFINRPPTTHKHSLQALSVYIHDDHTVKINPLICGPLSADFDGDCVHLFYPQSLAAKAEVLELFSVDKQLLSSHSGNLNLQLGADSMLSLKLLFKNYFLSKVSAQQLAMFLLKVLPEPAVVKGHRSGPRWTALQIIQTALPLSFNCTGDKHQICNSEILQTKMSRDVIQPVISDIVTSIFFEKGPLEVLQFFNSLQPLLMESLFSEGFSVGLEDFVIPTDLMTNIQNRIQDISQLLGHLRLSFDELVHLQVENHLRFLKEPIANVIQMSTAMGTVMDLKSESALNKVVQQVGFLGLQLASKGKFYSTSLVTDMSSLFQNKYPYGTDFPAEEFGLVRSCLFHGLDPYQEMVHSISAREVIVRSSRGLTEPGTLFKNLMAILRDVVICYDGTVRNVCSNSVIQFEYGAVSGTRSFFPAGEPVGVLAATAMSNPAYKAVLDSSPSSNSSWEMMKEILLSTVTFKNDLSDRRVILYLNDCNCKRKYCREKAAYLVKNHLRKVSLKDIAKEFLIEYNEQRQDCGIAEFEANLLGHIHLNKEEFQKLNLSMQEVCGNCEQTIHSFQKKKKLGHLFKRIKLSASETCSFGQSCGGMPCLKFWQDANDQHLERTSHVFSDSVCPVLLETIIKGDPRVCSAEITWVGHDTTTWIRNPAKSQKGELVVNVVLEKDAVKQSGDTWRIVMDSCLPVLHLIDTSRSIPHAIKQVQELLGISCAFEQAVQRLSTSVSMVAKGVLKEHLILLANSMTCAGNLIGFNSGGIKALSRSLNIQVPFTEATLFTPKKCFERAAEKSHLDSLSSIVGSCSWGKHVAVGTGSKFDVLWDTREVGPVQQDGIDVYNFLHLVRSSLNEDGTNSACLGAENDYLELETDSLEWGLSPERSSEKPVFEDSSDFLDDFKDKEQASSLNSESADMEWAVDKRQNTASASKSNDWSSWGAAKVQSEDTSFARGQEPTEVPQKWVSGASVSKSNDWASWGASKVQTEDTLSERAEEKDESWVPRASGPKSSGQSSWGAVNVQKDASRSSWELGKAQKEDKLSLTAQDTDEISQPKASVPWGATNKLLPERSGQDDDSNGGKKWGTNKELGAGISRLSGSSTWGAIRDQQAEKCSLDSDSNGGKQWETNKDLGAGTLKPSGWSSWAAISNPQTEKSSQDNASNGGKQWETTNKELGAGTKPSGWSSWGATSNPQTEKSSQDNDSNGGKQWGINKELGAGTSKQSGWSSWGATSNPQTEKSSQDNDSNGGKQWGINKELGAGTSKQSGWSSWGANAAQGEKSNQIKHSNGERQWGTNKKQDIGGESKQNGWSSWGANNAQTGDIASNTSQGIEQAASSPRVNGWGSADNGSGSSPGQTQWGHARRFSAKRDQTGSPRAWGPSNSGDWKNRASANFTATRQRLDMFPSEEQEILLEVEPIMHSIRRIFQQTQTGYTEGDPLTADDQRYVVDNVFNHHPEKVAKMGAGIDYVMISKHSKFQDTRCLYVVSTDGRKEDFSYRKCVENMIRVKFPEKADSFIEKYFKRPEPRPNREQQQQRERSATPAATAEAAAVTTPLMSSSQQDPSPCT